MGKFLSTISAGLSRWMRFAHKTSSYKKNGKPLKRLDTFIEPLQGFPISTVALGFCGAPKAATTRHGFFAPHLTIAILTLVLLVVCFAFPARAQEPATTPEVTADDVNTIAHKMYCPVCENIPLDVCPTDACAQWRAEIKSELEAGQTETEIINTFVARYGDRVVGTPQDPTLRALSLVTPWLIGIIVVGVAGVLLIRWWRKRPSEAPIAAAADGSAITTDDEYRARLERDLQSRR